MASPTHPPPFSEKELEEGLKDAGARLQTPPSSTEELLNLLDVRTLCVYIYICVTCSYPDRQTKVYLFSLIRLLN